MTETAEKQKEVEAIIQSLEDESDVFKRMARITEGLINYSKTLEAQVSSLTKERDEQNKEICRLIASIGELSYPYSYCRCEGQFEELDLSSDQTGDYTSSCKSCGLEVNEDEENSVVGLKAVDYAALKSQITNREKEIEELKGELEYHKEIVASHERAQKERHKVVELCFPPKSKGEAQ